MCAIAGLLSSAERLPFIRRMTTLMAHRSPDGEGSLFAGKSGTRVWAMWRIICLGAWMRLFNVAV